MNLGERMRLNRAVFLAIGSGLFTLLTAGHLNTMLHHGWMVLTSTPAQVRDGWEMTFLVFPILLPFALLAALPAAGLAAHRVSRCPALFGRVVGTLLFCALVATVVVAGLAWAKGGSAGLRHTGFAALITWTVMPESPIGYLWVFLHWEILIWAVPSFMLGGFLYAAMWYRIGKYQGLGEAAE